MSFYKIIKISILLGTGVLVACSPDKTNSTNDVSSSESNASNAPGLTVNIDPVTGEFLSEPPQNLTVSPNAVQSDPKYSDMKESTTPGGGIFIEAIGVKKKNSK